MRFLPDDKIKVAFYCVSTGSSDTTHWSDGLFAADGLRQFCADLDVVMTPEGKLQASDGSKV